MKKLLLLIVTILVIPCSYLLPKDEQAVNTVKNDTTLTLVESDKKYKEDISYLFCDGAYAPPANR